MILVDTNVWSEAFRPEPNPNVREWARRHSEQLWLSTVVIGELLSGVALLPDGRRKLTLSRAYDELVATHQDRIAPFDLDAAQHYGLLLALQERAGRNPGTADTQIAATARARGMTLATRNTRHFEGLGLKLIDPWAS
jgi:predicted nucleic acid-binding protein